MDQWKTLVSVTRAIVFSEIHFQKITSSGIACAFIFDFISMLKIWRVFCAAKIHTIRSFPWKWNIMNIKRYQVVEKRASLAILLLLYS